MMTKKMTETQPMKKGRLSSAVALRMVESRWRRHALGNSRVAHESRWWCRRWLFWNHRQVRKWLDRRRDLVHLRLQLHRIPLELPGEYGEQRMAELKKTAAQRTGRTPHLYAIAELAHRSVQQQHCSASVVVSGESGAGKTEAAKQLMGFVAIISGGGAGHEPAHCGYVGPGMLSAAVSGGVCRSARWPVPSSATRGA